MSTNGPGGQPQSPYDPPTGGQNPGPQDPAAGGPPSAPYGGPGQPQQPQPYPAPYQQGPAGQPGVPNYTGNPYQPYANPFPKNNLGVWSLVLGIVSIVMSCGLLSGIPAIIIGHKARQAVREGQADNDGLALAGIITGWIGTILITLVVIAYIAFVVFAISMSESSTTYSTY